MLRGLATLPTTYAYRVATAKALSATHRQKVE